MSLWIEEVFKQYELVSIQRYTNWPPSCDRCEVSRAIGMWQDWEGKGHALCAKCSVGAEPMIDGVNYRPTQYPKSQPVQKPVETVNPSTAGGV